MGHHFRELLDHHLLKHLLVNQDPQHVRVVVNGKKILIDGDKQPEALLLIHVLQKVACNEIHALAVADSWVTLQEGCEHIPKRVDELLNLVWRIVRESSAQIKLYLVEAQVGVLWVEVP